TEIGDVHPLRPIGQRGRRAASHQVEQSSKILRGLILDRTPMLEPIQHLVLDLRESRKEIEDLGGERPFLAENFGAAETLLEDVGHQAWGSRCLPFAHVSSTLASTGGALSCSSAQSPWWCLAHSSLTVPSVMARSAPCVMITAMWMCMTIERIAPTAD